MLEVHCLPVLQDNFIWVLHCPVAKSTVVVDPAEAEPVLEFLRKKNWKLDAIWNTHHHGDHVGGNLKIRAATNCQVIAFEEDRERIPGATQFLKNGDTVEVGKSQAEVWFLPGHTLGHIAFWFSRERYLFCGDVLFGMGCGRLFEGTAEQMWKSLQRISVLPKDTKVFCAHEYLLLNLPFARTKLPSLQAVQDRGERAKLARAQGHWTVPMTLSDELTTNPFLLAKNMTEFRLLRAERDNFRTVSHP